MRQHVIAAMVALFTAGAAQADSLTCANGKTVQRGMTTEEVRSRCGEPTSKNVWQEDVRAQIPSGASIKTGGKVKVEIWRYVRGSQKAPVQLEMRDGKVVTIRYESR